MPKLNVHSIETMATQDGPGIRFLLFLQGCQFRCQYCQNPDSQEMGTGKEMEIDDLVDQILKYRNFYTNGGVTVSGGEPTVQAKNLTILFQKLQENGIHTALDTNGYITSDEVKKLYEHTDLLILDIKHIDVELHKVITGKSNRNSLEMAEFREKQQKPIWLRYVYVPGLSDQEEHLHAWAKHFENYKMVEKVEIIGFHQLGKEKWKQLNRPYLLEKTKPANIKNLQRCKKIFSLYLSNVTIG